MQIIQAVLSSLLSLFVLYLLTRLIGNRQISQLSLFDYINGITIGSIAAEMATDLEHSPWIPLACMVIYGTATYAISVLCSHSLSVRRLFNGRPILLMDDGLIDRANLARARLDLSEFLMLARSAGYFSPTDIQTAMLEDNGTISFLPRPAKRPATPEDLNLTPPQPSLPVILIMDGRIMRENLSGIGRDEAWLAAELKRQQYASPESVLLALCDEAQKVTLFPMNFKTRKLR